MEGSISRLDSLVGNVAVSIAYMWTTANQHPPDGRLQYKSLALLDPIRFLVRCGRRKCSVYA